MLRRVALHLYWKRNIMSLETHYLEEIRRQLRGHKRLADGALAQVSDEEFFLALDPEANSVAITVKHIVGNMRSRFTDFLTTDGEKPDRHRDQEFEIGAAVSRSQMMQQWEDGWALVVSTVESLAPDDLMRTVTIRGEPHTVLQALNRALAHYAYHVGQIAFLAKHFRSAEWKSLSIPRGQSEEYNRKAIADRKPGPSGPRS
jgi:Protein of unknown function (DUF1572)